MLFFMIGLALLFILMGWGIHNKQWYFLISGYNTMSKEEQAKVDVLGLAKLIVLLCYGVAVLLVLLGLCMHFNFVEGLWIVTALLVVAPLVIVFKSRKYYNGMSTSSPKKKKTSLIIATVTLIGVGSVLYFAIQPTKFDMTDDTLHISGIYGEDMAWQEIESMELIEELPPISMRTNGSAVGTKLKGHFKFEDGTEAKLFIDKAIKRYIVIRWQEQQLILNEEDEQQTEALYEEMLVRWSK